MPPKLKTQKKGRSKAKKDETLLHAVGKHVVFSKKLEKQQKIHRQRWIIAIIVIVISIAAKLYKDFLENNVIAVANQISTDFINGFVCKASGAFCDTRLRPHQRSQMTDKNIPGGKTLIKIPRSLQIWDLDAVQDIWIQEEIKNAKHNNTGNTLDSGAFLAAYLCRRFISSPNDDDPLLPYYNILPSFRQLARHHPTLWDTSASETILHGKSSSYAVIKAYQDMMESEYNGFAFASEAFKEQIPIKDYLRMRVLVMSRSFGTGKPEGVTTEQLDRYNNEMGIDFSKGCRAMVPLLDMYNHHAKPNVEWKYDMVEKAFVVSSVSDGIPSGQEIFNSYGTYTDSHLFAKFGFVNGDGSGHTQASIAVFHRILDSGLKQQFTYVPANDTTRGKVLNHQRYIMSRYLQFDDGYSRCIRNATDTPKAYELKQWKLKHLVRHANRPESWILNMKPRRKDAKPPMTRDQHSTFKVPQFDLKDFDFDGSKLMSTCRLITLTWEDYDGNAVAKLKTAYEMSTDPFIVKHQTPNLEYRSLMCMARFSGLALSRYGKGFNFWSEVGRVEELNKESWGSTQWAASHVNLGEYMTLDLLNHMANSGVQEYTKRLSPNEPTVEAMIKIEPIRVQACNWSWTEALVNDTSL
jgi:SET domain